MSHTDCACHSVLYSEPYFDLNKDIWHYRVLGNQAVERQLENGPWKSLTEEDYSRMTSNHLEFVESLTL